LPAYAAHGTSLGTKDDSSKEGGGLGSNALQILLDGGLQNASDGTAGSGVYLFSATEFDPTDPKTIESAYYRGCTGGYTGGCCFVVKVHGIAINNQGQGGHNPDGSCGRVRDQLVAGSGSLEYIGVVFSMRGLVFELNNYLNKASNYSIELHDALMEAQAYVTKQRTTNLELGNACVSVALEQKQVTRSLLSILQSQCSLCCTSHV
jgi:hypothetical protein